MLQHHGFSVMIQLQRAKPSKRVAAGVRQLRGNPRHRRRSARSQGLLTACQIGIQGLPDRAHAGALSPMPVADLVVVVAKAVAVVFELVAEVAEVAEVAVVAQGCPSAGDRCGWRASARPAMFSTACPTCAKYSVEAANDASSARAAVSRRLLAAAPSCVVSSARVACFSGPTPGDQDTGTVRAGLRVHQNVHSGRVSRPGLATHAAKPSARMRCAVSRANAGLSDGT